MCLNFTVRQTTPKLGYNMKVTCKGCCIRYGSYVSFIRYQCGIKGSFRDFVPIFVDIEEAREEPSYFLLEKSPDQPSPRTISIFHVRGLLTNNNSSTTETYLKGPAEDFTTKGVLRFSTASAVLRPGEMTLT
jgi:hypothetical protein